MLTRSLALLFACSLVAALGCERPPAPAPVELEQGSAAQQAVVYGQDDRRDVYQLMDPGQLMLVDSSVVLVDEGDIIANNPNDVQFDAITLGQYIGLCSDESYTDHLNIGFCSGSLIDDDLVLTAGHCMRNNGDCNETRFVFNVHYEAPGVLHNVQMQRDVFECAEIITTVEQGDLDFAIVRLDRSAQVEGKLPVPVIPGPTTVDQDIVLVGYPTGIPLKIDAGGHVLNPGAGGNPAAFFGTADAFGGNSGSPVFNTANEQVGILVAGQTDYVFDNAAQCTRVNVLGANQGPGEVITYAQRAIDNLCDDIGYPSLRLCPQNVDPGCQSCPAEACPAGWQCGSHAGNPSVSFCREPCMVDGDCTSDGFTCQADFFCSPSLTTTCEFGSVWEVNACGDLVDLVESCPFGCMAGACADPSAGDTCDMPLVLDAAVSFHVIVGDNGPASDAYDNDGCNRNDGQEQVYTFTLDGPHQVEFYADNIGSDPLIHLRAGVCEDVAAEVFCDDDGGQGTDSNWQGLLGAGTYYFFMDSWGSNNGGQYQLEVTFEPVEQCMDQCDLGELRCAQDGQPGIEGCGIGPDGCTSWQFVLPCADGCEAGQCVGEECFDECPFEGASACLNDSTYGICGQFDDDECLDAQLQMCGPNEQCIEGEGCVDDGCDICEPGERRCEGPEFVEECFVDPIGCTFWEPVEFCNDGFCQNGECEGDCFDECFPGDEFCFDPFSFLPCGQFDGDPCFEFGPPQQCPPESTCVSGQCEGACEDTCTPDDQFCLDPFTRLPCGDFDDDPCLELGPPQPCGPGTECEDGECVAPCGEVCTVGEERCRDDGLLEACLIDDEGCTLWGPPFGCEGGGVCDPDTGACPDGCQGDCILGEAECLSDSSYRVCLDEDGDGCAAFTAPRFCFGATVCDEGLCVLESEPADGGPGLPIDAGPITFPRRSPPGRVKIAPAVNCAQSTPDGLAPLLGVLGWVALSRRRRKREA